MAEIPANLDPCLSPPINQSFHCAAFICVFVVVIILTYIHPAHHFHLINTHGARVHVCVMAPTGSAFSLNHLPKQ